ncbi:YciI family protein [Leifsonia aquatica]|uniref:YciI family protein n=1 Tax=Leifsonia aquatica TaxID=144185 RepID=UPI000468108F|nr:YciI family protein [Leifsonia aquatica]
MTKFLISFPSSAMVIPEGEFDTVVVESHAVMQEAKDAGVYVFGGGLNEDIPPVRVAGDGTVTDGAYPQTAEFDGGFCVLELPSREAAVTWAAKIATSCRCEQELREFGYDPES